MKRFLILACLLFALAAPLKAFAQCCECVDGSCNTAKEIIKNMHAISEPIIMGNIADQFNDFEKWETSGFFTDHVLPAMKRLTSQKIAIDKLQAHATGAFMDADQQMATQRLYQTMQAEAQKDYQPSEDFCWFGTNVRSMSASDSQGHTNAAALSARSLSHQLGASGLPGATSADADKQARWEQFTKTYCDVNDNNADPTHPATTGLGLACGGGPTDKSRVNKDVDYARLIDGARTLDVNFLDGNTPPDEQDVQAFLDNIFPQLSKQGNVSDMTLRTVAAKRAVAQNSFNAIIGMKSAGTSDQGNTREYLASIMKQLGLKSDEIYTMIGDKPSYYAQLEILAKSIYQTPAFYSKLYDKPANIERKAVALKAIDMMLDRALYESEERQEMLMSVLVASKARGTFKELNRN